LLVSISFFFVPIIDSLSNHNPHNHQQNLPNSVEQYLLNLFPVSSDFLILRKNLIIDFSFWYGRKRVSQPIDHWTIDFAKQNFDSIMLEEFNHTCLFIIPTRQAGSFSKNICQTFSTRSVLEDVDHAKHINRAFS